MSADLERLARELPGFDRVFIRPRTGSVVFEYSLEDTDPDRFRAALAARTSLIYRSPGGSPTAVEEPHHSPPLGAQLIYAVRDSWARADTRVLEATSGYLDLRSSVPWLLLLLALRQIIKGHYLHALPWYTALYYALQALMRYQDEYSTLLEVPPPPPAD